MKSSRPTFNFRTHLTRELPTSKEARRVLHRDNPLEVLNWDFNIPTSEVLKPEPVPANAHVELTDPREVVDLWGIG